ncbi:hypothetical protein G3O08_09675 [Cryomorpha ignava]|uniref:TonB C-terminal domain-containing protein n=1 Tax=Cryomorpha ignava TaxID=101383 RepID=A0A7K3WQ31_9FLAO|nr:energy transducer TonB [Cryomorpha ignava]NEN23769.1 hypothetical protein [Cryomorpha ignava]
MKKLSTLILTVLIILLNFSAHAGSNPGSEMQKLIRKEISYPKFAMKNQLQGVVMVQFEVSDMGYVQVKEMNASHDELGKYVRDQLEQLRLDPRKSSGMHFAKFTFRYEEL